MSWTHTILHNSNRFQGQKVEVGINMWNCPVCTGKFFLLLQSQTAVISKGQLYVHLTSSLKFNSCRPGHMKVQAQCRWQFIENCFNSKLNYAVWSPSSRIKCNISNYPRTCYSAEINEWSDMCYLLVKNYLCSSVFDV